ncbi:ubiquitin fusion degradation protein [Aureobasidium pullulans]|uniref:Ubiquitin fusion degradation protein n=1 Tax=Aureobasidium pullulans TaxID=5580 RepID=A0A4S9AK46_AURPU|nr:ubiquitin fusion degradation protein [Aureobasidium pullulans]THW79836.1 ubiquitin fusion degradation protein [Aureobasidium pullulans]THX35315.1 ubiquitin fusion degradation protein [Aureobasidium pullulans]THX75609.1 ubiquitin fusion degradation protein [Aureobasidium pullulans]THY23585.1 ubiquitin fusion degradation protein [Aureobasidium pullulans]
MVHALDCPVDKAVPRRQHHIHLPVMYRNDPLAMYNQAMLSRGGRPRRFDEYYRCYPVAMKTDREDVIHGGKVYLPASALDKLTQLHITYPMLFELINGAKSTKTHAGVLEFTAEEGKIYLPYWIMRSLLLDPGDLLQIKSTDLPSGTFIKLQPQSPAFLDISDPKAVLENVFRSYSCLTVGDVFSFSYVDQIHEIAVLEVKPDKESHSISVQETDLSVDFAAPVGYKEPERTSGTSTPAQVKGMGGSIHTQGTMAQAINYSAIAPNSTDAATGHAAAASHFISAGHRLVPKKGSKTATPSSTGTSTPAPAETVGIPGVAQTQARRNGPQPLRLPPGKLFFGYEIKPKPAKKEDAEEEPKKQHFFSGEGQTLRKKK